jgi:hypothetical protein
MRKRLHLLIPALALLASLAFATPGQAGTVVTTTIDFGTLIPASTVPVETIDITFAGTGSISKLSPSFVGGGLLYNSTLDSFTPATALLKLVAGTTNEVSLTFASNVTYISGYFQFTSSTPYSSAAADISIAKVTSQAGGVNGGGSGMLTTGVSFGAASVPEPSSMALLGIAMTSFLAFRRYFKRSAIA